MNNLATIANCDRLDDFYRPYIPYMSQTHSRNRPINLSMKFLTLPNVHIT